MSKIVLEKSVLVYNKVALKKYVFLLLQDKVPKNMHCCCCYYFSAFPKPEFLINASTSCSVALDIPTCLTCSSHCLCRTMGAGDRLPELPAGWLLAHRVE